MVWAKSMPNRTKESYLFAVRTPSEHLHHRLVDAAKDDNFTVAQELSMLLDLRDQWHALTGASHPLGVPAPVPEVVPLRPFKRVLEHGGRGYKRKRTPTSPKPPKPPTPPKPRLPVWRTRKTYNRGTEGVDWFIGPASAHLPGYYQRNLEQTSGAHLSDDRSRTDGDQAHHGTQAPEDGPCPQGAAPQRQAEGRP
jgi:hypothetical protein